MIKNYLTIALRNLMRNRLYTLINIIGLSVGMACAFLIFGFTRFEMRYDHHHQDADRIYRVIREVVNQGQEHIYRRMNTGPSLLPLIQNTLSGTEATTRLYESGGIVQTPNQLFVEGKFFFADPEIFDVFTLPLIQGNPKIALKDPFSILLTPKMANKYFGNESPMGKTLTFKNQTFKVTGILAPIPPNSHFHIDFLASFQSLNTMKPSSFFKHWDNRVWTYLKLKQDHKPKDVEHNIFALTNAHINKGSYKSVDLKLQALTNIHLDPKGAVEIEMGQNRDPESLYTLSMLAVVILLIACINFMNLSTARSLSRSREVGIRKIVGGKRTQIIRQFLGESLFLSSLSLVFALALIELTLPTFGNLVGKEVIFDYQSDPTLLLIMFSLTFWVGIGAGSYPALYLSAFRPVQVLKGGTSGRERGTIRKGLVVIQFALSVCLIVGTVVMAQQHHFLTNRNLGFDKEFLLDLRLNMLSNRTQSYAQLKKALLENPKILNITVSSNKPGVTDHNGIQIRTPGSDQETSIGIVYVTPNYVKTLGLNVIAGRDFDTQISADANNILLNQSALKKLGTNFRPGHPVELFYRNRGRIVPRYMGKTIGIIQDFNHRPLTDGPPQPLIFATANSNWAHSRALIRIAPQNTGETVAFIQDQWHQLFPSQPFRYSFLDADIERVYRAEKRWQTIFTSFAGLAIVIASLGLFGLSAFTAERRTKEIGIRKVMGASVGQIVILLSREFTGLVIIANAIAWPIAYDRLNDWLQNYYYHIDLTLGMFIWSGLLALSIAWITVAYQAIKAACANPIDALRYE